jgi:hypothetical protein
MPNDAGIRDHGDAKSENDDGETEAEARERIHCKCGGVKNEICLTPRLHDAVEAVLAAVAVVHEPSRYEHAFSSCIQTDHLQFLRYLSQ